MKRSLFVLTVILGAVTASLAQERLTFTGTAVIYGSGFNTRTVTSSFTLRIRGTTSNQDVARYLRILQDDGQDRLLEAIDDNDLGSFELGGRIGPRLNAVTIENLGGGTTRVRAIFERWKNFGELRGGYRSLDYPFGYVEIHVNSRTGKGDGTFIPAAKIRFREKNGGQVEIEDFGTFPGRLMGVRMRGQLPF